LDSATTSQVCGNRRKVEQFTEYTKRVERKIRDVAERVAGRATGHGDVRLRLRLLGGQKYEIVERNILHVEGAHNSFSQS
jgi:hypothetical protein